MIEQKLRFTSSTVDWSLKKWEEFKLVIPSVSISNVGQMAVDMLIHNLSEKIVKVANIYDDAVLPITGRNSNSGLLNNLEVYVCDELKLVVMQQRAPFVKGRIPHFRARLLGWVRTCRFQQVVILSSVSSHIRSDAELTSGLSSYRFVTTDDTVKSQCKDFGWLEYDVKKNLEHKASYDLPGAGIVRSLFEECDEAKISLLGLLVYCNSGEAISEVMGIVKHFLKYINATQLLGNSEQLKFPPVWTFPGAYRGESIMF